MSKNEFQYKYSGYQIQLFRSIEQNEVLIKLIACGYRTCTLNLIDKIHLTHKFIVIVSFAPDLYNLY